jgi:DNA polymerase V
MDEHLTDLAGGDGVSVHSGFPNPALDRRGQDQGLALDLNQLLVRHPSSTYLFRIAGHRWSDQGIYDGDVAVIDRSLAPRPADLLAAWQDNGFVLYRQRQLAAEGTPWGVVTAVIHQYRS